MASFQPKPTLQNASTAAFYTGAFGLFFSAVQNALGSHSYGATGVLTRTGGTIGFCAAMGFTFAATESMVANHRQTDDAWNGASGACAAGFLAGIRARSIPAAVGGCAILGGVMGTYDLVGAMIGNKPDEEKRKRFFKDPQNAVAN